MQPTKTGCPSVATPLGKVNDSAVFRSFSKTSMGLNTVTNILPRLHIYSPVIPSRTRKLKIGVLGTKQELVQNLPAARFIHSGCLKNEDDLHHNG